jgi:hypothetical protein
MYAKLIENFIWFDVIDFDSYCYLKLFICHFMISIRVLGISKWLESEKYCNALRKTKSIVMCRETGNFFRDIRFSDFIHPPCY